MKKLFSVLLILISLNTFSQKDTLGLYLKCYKGGDTIAIDSLKKIPNLSILRAGKGQNDCSIAAWEIAVYNDGVISLFPGYAGPTIAGQINEALRKAGNNPPEKIVFQGLIVNVKTGDAIVKQKLNPVTFYLTKKARKICK